MHPALLIVSVGILFILIFGGISFLRREGLSSQFALESLGITAVVAAASWLTALAVNPVIFLIFLYLLTMRVRIIVDLANIFSNRGRQKDAIRLLNFAMRLLPDRSSRLVTLVNMGIVQLRRKNPESAKDIFLEVLQEAEAGGLGIKYEAACRYNLALAYQKIGRESESVRQYNEVISLYPHSIYGRAADIALAKRRSSRGGSGKDNPE